MVSKQLQLLSGSVHALWLLAVEYLYVSKLLIGDAEYPDLSVFWQEGFNSLDVNVGIFLTRTMTNVNGKLKHGETVFQQFLPELISRLTVFLRLSRQIEQNQNPHDAIFTEAFHNHIVG